MKNFPGPFQSPQMFKYKEKTAFTYNIQSVVHCRKLPFEPLEKCMTFKDIFPGLSRTLSFNFQDFPGPKCRLRNDLYCVEWDVKLYYIPYHTRTKVIFQDFPGPGIFKKKIQDFPGGVGTLKVDAADSSRDKEDQAWIWIKLPLHPTYQLYHCL